jgi:multidrug efflux pump subunit AcrB
LGAGAVFLAGAGVEGAESPDTLYLQIEFEGGFRAEEGDRLLLDWAEELRTHKGIGDVQTSARSGSASALVTFDPERMGGGELRTLVRSIPIPGAFVYIPESSGGERIWELVISGEDDERCRELAREAAGICRSLPFVRETVLNFKDGGPRLTLRPDREKLYARSLSFYEAAGAVRRGVYGPVAYKRIEAEGEIDVRVRGGGKEEPALEDTLGLLVSGVTGRVDSLMIPEKGKEPSSIQRRDRRRIASLSFGTKPMDPRRVRDKLRGPLEQLKLPPGYTIEFDREAVEKAENLSGILWRFLGALLFCYMVIAAAHESFILPLLVLSVVPPSLAAPALLLAGSGRPVTIAAACAFVAVSGMAVNAAVLTSGAFVPFLKGEGDLSAIRVYRVLKNLLPSLLATGGTTVLGALPFLFLREGSNELVRTLSLVTSLGVGSSCLFSLLLIPPGIKAIGGMKKRKRPPP